MATAKKAVAKAAPKKTVAKTVAQKRAINEAKSRLEFARASATKPPKAPAKREQTFDMPMEVKDWIDQAMSRMKSMQAKIDRLETENKELRSWRKWAEHRILGSSPE